MSRAKQYHTYARDCLKCAEEAEDPDIRQKLIELSRAWIEVALETERTKTIAETSEEQ